MFVNFQIQPTDTNNWVVINLHQKNFIRYITLIIINKTKYILLKKKVREAHFVFYIDNNLSDIFYSLEYY